MKPRLLLIFDQPVPPVNSGTTQVYKMWLDRLAGHFELFAIVFAGRSDDFHVADAYLKTICAAHLILPQTTGNRFWKLARALSRLWTGALFGPAWVEEGGRAAIERQLVNFIQQNATDLCLASKIHSLRFLGRRVCRLISARLMLDLHDDFVERERIERSLVAELRAAYPALKRFPPLRHLARLHRLSRFSSAAARRQERGILALCRVIFIASADEKARYAALMPSTTKIEPISWPVDLKPARVERAIVPRYDAGFIASGASFNIAACLYLRERILPAIRAIKPDFSLLIVGGISKAARRLGDWGPQTEIVDRIETIADFYTDIRLAIVPLRHGTGVSLKTLEALTYGCPVVSTSPGARGIPAALGRNLHVANDAHAFAALVGRLLDDQPVAQSREALDHAALRDDAFVTWFSGVAAQVMRSTP